MCIRRGVADAIEYGIIKKCDNGELSVTIPAMNLEHSVKFEAIVKKYLDPIIDEYLEIAMRFVDGYRKLFPEHLESEYRTV